LQILSFHVNLCVQEVEEREIEALQEALHQSQSRNQALLDDYSSLRAALAACSEALSPVSLSAALLGESDEQRLKAFEEAWGGSDGYHMLHARLQGKHSIVTAADSQQVVLQLQGFLASVKTLVLDAERKEAAIKVDHYSLLRPCVVLSVRC
jgi:hypothetical protein